MKVEFKPKWYLPLTIETTNAVRTEDQIIRFKQRKHNVDGFSHDLIVIHISDLPRFIETLQKIQEEVQK